MIIYVVERIYDYTVQLGWSTSRKVAEEKCKEYNKQNLKCWVKEYRTDKNGWSEFDGD